MIEARPRGSGADGMGRPGRQNPWSPTDPGSLRCAGRLRPTVAPPLAEPTPPGRDGAQCRDAPVPQSPPPREFGRRSPTIGEQSIRRAAPRRVAARPRRPPRPEPLRLVDGQRPVRGPEAQREGQRAFARPDLLAGVDVEQPEVLQQLPPPSRNASATSATGTSPATTRATSSEIGGYGDAYGAGRASSSGIASRSSSIAQVRGGRPERLDHLRVQLARVPTTQSPTSSAAHRPGCHGGRPPAHPQRDPGGPPTSTTGLHGVGPAGRPARAPTSPRPRGRRPAPRPTCTGCAGSAASISAISASLGRPVHRRSGPGTGCRAAGRPDRSRTARGRATPRPVADQRVQQPGQQRAASSGSSASSGLST